MGSRLFAGTIHKTSFFKFVSMFFRPARSGPPAYTGFPITEVLPVCWVPRDRHDRPTQEGAAVKGTVEYRSPSGEDMPRKPLDGCKAAHPLAVPPAAWAGPPIFRCNYSNRVGGSGAPAIIFSANLTIRIHL